MDLKEQTDRELIVKLFERINLLELDNIDLRREVRLLHNVVRFLPGQSSLNVIPFPEKQEPRV